MGDTAASDTSAGDTAGSDVAAADAAVEDAGSEDAGFPCASDWWDCNWHARLKLTFDNSQQDEHLDDFPVLVKLTRDRADMDAIATGGADLRFVDADGVQVLPHEIERWQEGQRGWVWVKVPRVDAQSTTDYIWMYYDNGAAGDAQDPVLVWSADYRAVWHLSNRVDSSIPLPGTNVSDQRRGTWVDGVAGRGFGADGNDDRILYTADDAVLGVLDDMSISAWVRRDELDNGWRGIFSATHGDESDFTEGNFVFQCIDDGFGFENNSPFPSSWRAEVATPRQWHLLTMVVDTVNNVGLLYLDGRDVGSWAPADNTPTWSDQDAVRLGARFFGDNETAHLDGAIDEVRVAGVARSAAWLRAQYLAQSDAFLRYGEEPWLRPSFTHRIKLRLVSDDQQENLLDFPVLVTLDSGVLDYGLIQADGDDLRFLDADGHMLSHEIDDWDPGGVSQIWVRVPQVNAYNITDHIWLYYGNPVVSSLEAPTAVWSADYVGVWHLSDFDDSTANANNGANDGTASEPGVIADAIDVDDDGDGERVEVADSASLDNIQDELTASLWVYRETNQGGYATGMARAIADGGYDIFWLGFLDNDYLFLTSITDGSDRELRPSSPTPPLDQWFYLAGTYNGRKMRLFVDGEQIGVREETGTLPTDDNPFSIGGNDNSASWTEQLEGFIDEVRLQSVTRGPAWMLAEHWSMSDALILYDSPQPRDP